ncbi:hypothetical protein LshimejAT787_0301930 [Lyophyllum shimeji]|uniref:WHIM1 domain-containing protein n=1 Tax=Lyophyllum shimeji TaxID=47721 RepID=A0A9P3ULQ8_LYOSH|nr:hypothetical protein LshimejAT787_0301930 [Lyophyllum shimeji]
MSGVPKGHVCPPSDATHPSGRWETLFVYSFICKFTDLRGKVDGLETPMDLEEALMSREPNEILSKVLQHFILNLKPQTRNLSTDQISTTVAAVLADYFKASERTVFWNEDLKMNVDPFVGLEGGFFTAGWDFKLKILRQLVELQLCHTAEIKGIIDRAWGVSQNKHKKKDAATAPPEPSDPKSQDSLQLLPIGQDSQRKRFWVADDSPRVWVSTNPWKITATFQTVSSTKEEYLALIEQLKASAAPEPKKGQKRTRLEQAHLSLIAALESRIEAIDAELERVARVRKRIEQREHRKLLLAQAEVRETRTRRRTQKPDYVYSNVYDSEDDADEYTYQEEDAQDEEFDEDDFLNFRDEPGGSRRRRAATAYGERRRSTRTAAKVNANGKRESSSDSLSHWRGERRSARLGGPEAQFDTEPPPKRARTEDTMSTNSAEAGSASTNGAVTGGLKLKTSGAAALKPTEVALEEIAGKKRSKFWVYAVEPISDAVTREPLNNGAASPATNGHGDHRNGNGTYHPSPSPSGHENGKKMDFDRSLGGSLSPLDS